jgi:hypothetical protein
MDRTHLVAPTTREDTWAPCPTSTPHHIHNCGQSTPMDVGSMSQAHVWACADRCAWPCLLSRADAGGQLPLLPSRPPVCAYLEIDCSRNSPSKQRRYSEAPRQIARQGDAVAMAWSEGNRQRWRSAVVQAFHPATKCGYCEHCKAGRDFSSGAHGCSKVPQGGRHTVRRPRSYRHTSLASAPATYRK